MGEVLLIFNGISRMYSVLIVYGYQYDQTD